MPDSNYFQRPWSRFRLLYGCCLILTVALYTYGFLFDSKSGFRVGTMFLAVTLLYVPLFLVKKDDRIAALKKAKRRTAGILVFVGIFIFGGEITLRIAYWDGYSFGSHSGPLVKRFERNFRYNRYDGPSRGPEIDGTTKPDTLRVLAQGDSITWGQGLRSEENLFSTLLLAAIRDSGRPAEMAVLARPGREIDGHLEQLRKWRQEIDPDVIIYQWYVNDIELDKSSRPTRAHPPWRIRYVHQLLATSSYLYYFLDYHFRRMLPSSTQKYEDYLAEKYAKDSIDWIEFERVFQTWAQVARNTTPRVLVTIYPHMKYPVDQKPTVNPYILEIQERLVTLCQSENLQVLNLYDALSAQANSRELVVNDYDGHPSAAAHHIIATALEMSLREAWPEIFAPDAIIDRVERN